MKKDPPIAFKIIIMIVTFCVCFLGAELLLRIKNADQKNYNVEMWRYSRLLKMPSKLALLGHEHKPHSSAKLEGVVININSLGMRGAEPDLNDHTKKHILFLGDSNILGWGVEEDKTITGIIQQQLGNSAQVFNAGVGNYNATRYIALFTEKLRYLKPDVVVVQYFINDAEHLSAGGGNILLRNSQLALLCFHAIQTSLHGSQDISKLEKYYQNLYQTDTNERREMEQALRTLAQIAKEDRFKVIFAMTPESHDLHDYHFRFIHEYMRNFVHQLGWDYVDFLEPLRQYPPDKLWVMPGDPHYNALGHEVMAKTLLPYLK